MSHDRQLQVLLGLLLVALLAVPTLAQVPTTLNYQGRLLQNTADQDAVPGSVDIVFSIWSGPTGDAAAIELWSESWTGVSLSNGIFSVLLGSNGSPLDPADFQGDASLFLQLVIDGETLEPRQQLGSAPFAFVDEPANELQDLSVNNDELALSGSAATVDLSPYLDNTDAQDLSRSGNALTLTGDATSVDLSSYLDNTDAQTLALSGNDLTISGSGSSVDLSQATVVAGLGTRLTDLETDQVRTVFVTSQTYDGDLGGLSGADALCQGLADSAGLSGLFRAWLADDTGSPATRFDRLGSFERVDGLPIADDWADLTDGTLANPIEVTELGTAVGSVSVWTHTNPEGEALANTRDCEDWTSTGGFGDRGDSASITGQWTDNGFIGCGNTFRLYCFEQRGGLLDNQRLALDGNRLELTSDDGTDTVDLSPYLDNTDTDNQALSLSSDTLRLTSDDGTDTVDLSVYLDNTDDQALSRSGNELRLTSDDGTDTVDLSAYLDNTDDQMLVRSGNNLQLTSDNGTDVVDLSAFLDNTDNQALSLSGNTLQLTSDDGTDSVDLSASAIIAELLARLEVLERVSPRTVFVSSQRYTGNLGGLTGADALCQGLADAAGLHGTFLAWLSDSTDSPATRFMQGNRPFELVDGTRVADDWADLTDGTLTNPINIDQTGTTTNPFVWTSTFPEGTLDDDLNIFCLDWTTASAGERGLAGRAGRTNSEWTRSSNQPCDFEQNLYCFEN